MSAAMGEYRQLLEIFFRRGISAEEFQRAYLEKFKNEIRTFDESLFNLLDELFGDVDSFCADPRTLATLQAEAPEFYLDEQSLRDRVSEALQRLSRIEMG